MVQVSAGVAVVIEDDEYIRDLIRVVLEKIGLEVIAVGNAAEGIEVVRERQPVIVTLDVNLPGIDGFEAAARIRAVSQVYIVMITARDDEIDTLQGLGAGADDYVVKPFRPRELRARIEAMLRRPHVVSEPARFLSPEEPPLAAGEHESREPARSGPPDGAATVLLPSAPHERWLTHNGLRLAPDSRLVEFEGVEIALTQSEFDLLRALMASGRRVRNKSELATLLHGDGYGGYVSDTDRRSVEVHMSNLRRKLGEVSEHARIIETVRGIGYRLTAPEDLSTQQSARV